MSDSKSTPKDQPTLRQQFHAATGDRDKEAEALVDATGVAVNKDDAVTAVRQQHRDIPGADPSDEHNVVSPEKAQEVLGWLRAEQRHHG